MQQTFVNLVKLSQISVALMMAGGRTLKVYLFQVRINYVVGARCPSALKALYQS